MKKILCLISILYLGPSWGANNPTDYILKEIINGYQILDADPNRVILFDANQGSYDDQETEIILPFPFSFYGLSYDSLRVSTNGYLVFPDNQTGTSYTNTDLPDAQAPNGIIAPFWDDLAVLQGGSAQISYTVQGNAPNRILIIDYESVDIRAGANPTDDYVSTQVKLFEQNDVIEFHYGPRETNDGYTDATIGLEHPCGCIAARGPNYVSTNDTAPTIAYRYTPTPKYYARQEVGMNYEDLEFMPNRVILFDALNGDIDDQAAELDLPFPFFFYEQEFSSLRVSTNGYLVFPDNQSGVIHNNQTLPNEEDPNGIIAIYWDDLRLNDTSNIPDQISYVLQGQAPNRTLIIDYRSVTIGFTSNNLYAQVKLYEGSHIIELHYGDNNDTNNVTIGLEHPCGCIAEPGPNYNWFNDIYPDKAFRYIPYAYDIIFEDGLDGN